MSLRRLSMGVACSNSSAPASTNWLNGQPIGWHLIDCSLALLFTKVDAELAVREGNDPKPLFASALRGLSWAKIHWVGREGVEISPLVPSSGSAAFDSLTLWIHHWLSLPLIEQLVRSITRWFECVLNELLNYGMLSLQNVLIIIIFFQLWDSLVTGVYQIQAHLNCAQHHQN